MPLFLMILNWRSLLLCCILWQLPSLYCQANEVRSHVSAITSLQLDQEKELERIIELKDSLRNSNAIQLSKDVYHEYGRALFLEGEKIRGVLFTQKAVDEKSDPRDPIDTLSLQKSLSNLSLFQYGIGEYSQAWSNCNKLLEYGGANRFTGKAYSRLGEISASLGDPFSAINYQELGLEDFEVAKDYRTYFKVSINLAADYNSLKEEVYSRKAIETIDRAYAKIDQNSIPIHDLLQVSLIKGNAYIHLGEYEKATPFFDDILTGAKQQEDTVNMIKALNNLGSLKTKLDKPSESLNHLTNAVNLAVGEYKSEWLPLIYNNMGDTYESLENQEKAAHYYQQAITEKIGAEYSLFLSSPDQYLTSEEDLPDMLDYLISLAHFYSQSDSQQQKEALSLYKVADSILDKIVFSIDNFQTKLFWRKYTTELYEKAVATAIKLNNREDGFYFLEKNKALLLLERLQLAKAKQFANIPREQILEEQILEEKIAAHKLESKQSISEKKELVELEKQLSAIQRELEQKFPKYKAQKEAITIPSVDMVRNNILSTKEAMLQYLVGEEASYLFILTPDDLFFRTVELDSESFESLIESLKQPFTQLGEQVSFINDGYSLFRELIPEEVYGETIEQLLIVPDKKLNQLPFEVLIKEQSEEKELSSLFLINDFQVRYGYSAAVLLASQRAKTKYLSRGVSFSPVEFGNQNLPTLSDEEELKSLSALSKFKSYSKSKATKENFLQIAPSTELVHLYTHAQSDSSSSWIAFSDEKIHLEELYSLPFSSSLLVLGACETLSGKVAEGEGTLSFARAFTAAGVSSVVASLWKIDDSSTALITKDFYSHIQKGFSTPQALHQAKLNYLNSHSLSQVSPYYWSSLVIVGNEQTFNFKESSFVSNKWIGGLLLSVILLAMLFWGIRYRKRVSQ